MSNLLLFIALLMLNYFLAFPGFLSSDSLGQYNQSHNLVFNNHHPAVMAIIWSYLNKIYDGTELFLLLNLSLLWASCYLFYLKAKESNQNYAWIYFIIPFSPGILSTSIMIWKDVLFAHSIILCIAIAYYCHNKTLSKRVHALLFIVLSLLIFIGCSVKFQAKFILPMIIVIWCVHMYKMQLKKAVGLGVVSTLLFFSAHHFVNYINNVKDTGSQQSRQFFDLAGMSICLNEELFPQYIKQQPTYSFDKIKKYYDPTYVDSMLNPSFSKDGTSAIYKSTLSKGDLDELEGMLYFEIVRHTGCYLQHRAKVFHQTIKVKAVDLYRYEQFSLPADLKDKLNYMEAFFPKYINPIYAKLNLLTRAYVFLILDLIFLYLLCKKSKARKNNFFIFLIATNLIFYISMFFSAMAAYNRYVYFCILSTSLMFPYLMQRIKQVKNARS